MQISLHKRLTRIKVLFIESKYSEILNLRLANFALNFINFVRYCSKHVPNEPAISKESVTSKTQQRNKFDVVRLISGSYP